MIPVRVLIVALLAMALGTSSEHLSRSTLLKRQSVPAASDFCKASKLGLSDGTQKRGGSCSSTPQGSLPSAQNMVSTLIVNPDNGAQVDASKDLLVRLNTRNLVTGFFDDPNAKYYLSPQTLDGSGRVQGHQHAVIQKIEGTNPPDAQTFAFFKGLEQPGGSLSVTIPAGTLKTDGLHRICTLTGSRGHQPVVMPVAQRGSQDDCIRVNVINSGKAKAPVAPPPPPAAAQKPPAFPKKDDKKTAAQKGKRAELEVENYRN